MENSGQTDYKTQPAQLTKTELNDLIHKAKHGSLSTCFISRTQAWKECIRRAEAYQQISQYAGRVIIACLVLVVLVQLLE